MDISGLQTPRLRRLAEIVAAQALAMQERPEDADGAEDGEGQEMEGNLPEAEAEGADMVGEPPAYDDMLDEEDYGEEALEDEAAAAEAAAVQQTASRGLAITGLDPGGKGPNHDPLLHQPPPTPFPHQNYHQHPHPSSQPQRPPPPQQLGDGYDETF